MLNKFYGIVIVRDIYLLCLTRISSTDSDCKRREFIYRMKDKITKEYTREYKIKLGGISMYEILCFFMPILGIAWFVGMMQYFNSRYSIEMKRRDKTVMCVLKIILGINVWIRIEMVDSTRKIAEVWKTQNVLRMKDALGINDVLRMKDTLGINDSIRMHSMLKNMISIVTGIEIEKYSLESMMCFLYIDVLLGTFLLISWIDYRKKIIPDSLNSFLMCMGLMALVMSVIGNKFDLQMIHSMSKGHSLQMIHFLQTGQEVASDYLYKSNHSLINIVMIPLKERVEGLFILSVPLLLINMIYPGGFGGGDVKFLAAAGFNLGLTRIVYGTLIGSFFSAAVCIVLLSFGKIKRREKIAFGPFLCVGAMIVVLGG